ncbi:MAG TPA: hypothetical protein VJ717_19965 [Gemmatimonadaceae bacterium]|nr:hypothetical protein [Gemmatimonadaceae bacterium]
MASHLHGQSARKSYYNQVPPAPQLVGQTAASARLSLYGDRSGTSYRDSAPVDGIDDTRARRLASIAERFSPILRRNNFSVPRDFRTIGARLVMHADHWADGHLQRSDSVELSCCIAANGADPKAGGAATDDAKLVELLRHFDPRGTDPRFQDPEPQRETILYFDFPGSDERTWRDAYREHDPRKSAIFAHPFIDEVATGGERRLSLVMQYWFYYPFNDSANNHEGDWEHLNVGITTLAQAAQDSRTPGPRGRLSESDVLRLLDADGGVPLDSMTIRFVTYYFHQHAMQFDYLAAPVAHDAPADSAAPRLTPAIWEDVQYISNALRRRRAVAGGRLESHPIGYIGGNSRGLDELLAAWPRFGGSFNRNSHGTYPLPGTWRAIGPLGASEKVFGDVEPRIRERPSDRADSIPWHDLIDDDRYLTYRRESIQIIPDWERVIDLYDENAAVRREWAWLILPIHFGFPASKSPGAGVVQRTDLGNIAPTGPAFDPGWNRPFTSTEYHAFDPHVLRIAFAPVSPFTGLQNGWGIFNLPIALAGLIPGTQVVTAQIMPWISGALGIAGAPPGKTFYAGKLPRRFTSFGAGRFVQFGGDDFARMLPHEKDDSVARFLARGGYIDDHSYRRDGSDGNRIWLLLHYGDRFAIENTFSIDTTQLGYTIRDSGGAGVASVAGLLAMRQLSSGIRFSGPLFGEALRGHLRAGYTWTWYEVDHATLNGHPLATGRTRGGHAPSLIPSTKWWPNSMYAGAGLELFAPRRAWILGRLGYGIAVELSAIAFPFRGPRCSCVVKPGEAAFSLVFGW